MPRQKLTPQLKRDLQILRHRNYLDRRQFFKTRNEDAGKLPTQVKIGTMVDPLNDARTGRTNIKHGRTFASELLKDAAFAEYSKRTYGDVSRKRSSGGKREYHERQRNLKPAWAKKRSKRR